MRKVEAAVEFFRSLASMEDLEWGEEHGEFGTLLSAWPVRCKKHPYKNDLVWLIGYKQDNEDGVQHFIGCIACAYEAIFELVEGALRRALDELMKEAPVEEEPRGILATHSGEQVNP